MWQMQFNIDKCFILRVGSPKHKLVHLYTLHNQNLSETDSAKYVGLTITSDLQWNQHINNKANSILGLLRRNLRIPSQTIKTYAYQSLVRPHLEYASTVWDPHTDTPQFRGGNPYFFSENPYTRIIHLCIDLSRKRSRDSYRDAVCKKIATLCNKNRQPAANNQNRSFTSRGGLGIDLRL